MDSFSPNDASPKANTEMCVAPNAHLSHRFLANCYKTPDYQQFSSHFIHPNGPFQTSFYPTPPSDTDETSSPSFSERCHLENNTSPTTTTTYNNLTPTTLNHHYYGRPNSPSVSSELFKNDTSLEEQKNQHLEVIFAPLSEKDKKYKRRSRTCYSKQQLDILEETFQTTHYPDIQAVDELSVQLNLSTERISIWFQNRRARFKRSKLEAKEKAKENRFPKSEFAQQQQPNQMASYPMTPQTSGYSYPLTTQTNASIGFNQVSSMPISVNGSVFSPQTSVYTNQFNASGAQFYQQSQPQTNAYAQGYSTYLQTSSLIQ